jgi:hypothetical protein
LRSFFKAQGSIHEADNESKIEYSVHDLEKTVPWPWSTKALDELITSSRVSYLSRN